jgi:DNA-binding MarR family transcriptional regulator/CheY-like chemotaxis protein
LASFSCSILFLSEDADGTQRADLAQPEFQIIRVSNVGEARQVFAMRPEISVVIVDLDTAGTDGSHLAAALRTEHPERNWVEFVFLSRSKAAEFDQTLDVQSFEVLSKPLSPGQLLAAVTEGYNSSRLRQFGQEEQRTLDAPIAEFQARVGAATSQLLARIKQGYGAAMPSAPPARDERDAARQLRTLINEEQMRARLRAKVFGSLARNRASWMLLLVLSEAFQAGQEVTIKGTAYHAGLPLSSALRRLNEMCSQGLILRRGDPGDARRSFVSLTPLGQSYFVRYATEMSRAEETGKTS